MTFAYRIIKNMFYFLVLFQIENDYLNLGYFDTSLMFYDYLDLYQR